MAAFQHDGLLRRPNAVMMFPCGSVVGTLVGTFIATTFVGRHQINWKELLAKRSMAK